MATNDSSTNLLDEIAEIQKEPSQHHASLNINSVLLLVFVTSVTLVLQVLHLLTDEPFPVDALNIFRLILITVSIISMAREVSSARERLYSVSNTPDDSSTQSWCERVSQPVTIRLFVLTIYAFASSIGPVLTVITVFKCLRNEVSLLLILRLLSETAVVVFCLTQLVFIGRYRHLRCVFWEMKFLLPVHIGTNLSLCITSLFHFAGNEALDANNTNHSSSTIGAFESHVLFKEVSQYDDSSQCDTQMKHWQHVAGVLHRMLYTFMFGYCVLSLVSLFRASDQSREHASYEGLEGTRDPNANYGRFSARFKFVGVFVRFICKHSLKCSLGFCSAIFALHIAYSIKDKIVIDPDYFKINETESTSVLTTYSVVRSVYYYLLCIVSFVGFLLVRKQIRSRRRYTTDEILLILGLFSHTILIVFETLGVSVDLYLNGKQQTQTKVSAMFKAIFHFLGVYCQSSIILKYSSNARATFETVNRKLYVRAIITFIGICNFERWLRDSILPPVELEYLDNVSHDNLGIDKWWYILRSLMPVVAFYRVQSALMLYKISHDMRQS